MTGKTHVPDGWRLARLGPVPQGWELRRIDGLIERVDDTRSEIEPEPTVLSCSKDHGLIPQMELFQRRLASADTRRYKLVHPGDFVYDPNLLWSGAIARSHEQAIGIVSPVYEIFRVVRDCSQDFLFAWLMSPSRLPSYRAISMGTNVRRRRADFGDFSKLPILLPPLPEQRAIAAVLDRIDDAMERTEAVIVATERLRDTLLHELLTRGVPGLHSEWKEALGIGTIPACWDVVRLGDVAEVERGKFAHRPRNEPKFYGGDIPFIQTGDVVRANGIVKQHSQTLNELGLSISRLFPAGTIIITIAANIGETAIAGYPVAFPDSLVGVTPNGIDTRFLEYFLRTQKARLNLLAPESAQKNINLEDLRPLLTPLPPAPEQQTIVAALESVDEAIERGRMETDMLRSLKASAAEALLTGRVRVGGEGKV